MPDEPSVADESRVPEPRRQRFTPFGAIMFGLSILLLVSKFVGPVTGAGDLVQELADGFKQVDAFAFARNYWRDFNGLVAPSPPSGSQPEGLLFSPPPAVSEPGGMSVPIAIFAAYPAAIRDSLAAGGWATVGLILALAFGFLIMWDAIKESWLWVAAVPLVGGAVAFVLSWVVAQVLIWAGLVILPGRAVIAGASPLFPHLSDAVADLLDKFHLTKSVVSDASRVYGRGKIADAIERLERRPPGA